MNFFRYIWDDLRSDFRRFTKIFAGIVWIGLVVLTISQLLFGYERTDADVPCGIIAAFIIAVTYHQYLLSETDATNDL